MNNESDLRTVVSKYLPVTDKGNTSAVCCPFHKEKTPSLTIWNDNNSSYCFGCGWSGDEIQFVKEYLKVDFKTAKSTVEEILGHEVKVGTDKEKKVSKAVVGNHNPMPPEAIREFQKDKVFQNVNYRGIRKETDEFYRTLSKLDDNGKVIARYYPETKDGKLMGYKCRNHPKDFSHGKVGVTGIDNDLSGQHLFKANAKYVLVCGGEEDKLAAYQMFVDQQREGKQEEFATIPVVSPTSGETSAAKQCAANYDWFNMYDIIVIGMDNDEVGNKSAKAIAEVLPKEKIRIATWTGKDPNQMLVDGHRKQFVRDFYNAKDYLHSDIKTSKDADKDIEVELSRLKVPLPPFMSKLQYIMAGGIAMGYIINLGAQTGGGKTTIVNEMIYYWIFNSPHKIGILSLELSVGQYQICMLSRHIGKKIQLIEDPKEAVEFVNQPWVLAKREELREDDSGRERYTILDERDGTPDSIKKQIIRLVKKYGCKLIVIDPLNDVFEGWTLEQQTDFIKFLKGIVKEGVSIFNVCHITKGSTEIDKNTGKRKVRKLTESDFAGVSNIAKSGGCNIFATRDKYAATLIEQNTTLVEVPKCRWTGRQGPAGEWYYDNETHMIHELSTWLDGPIKTDERVEQTPPEYKEVDVNELFD